MFDLIIIGTGPAGYGAALYAARYKINTLVIGAQEGGMASLAHSVENYLGVESLSGVELMRKCRIQVERLGVQVVNKLVKNILKKADGFEITLSDNAIYQGRAVILALGTEKRTLGIQGEKEFLGKGVSYCATCDGFFFKNKTVAVVGGSDSAVTAAFYLADLAQKVFLVYRGTALRSEPIWTAKLAQRKNVVQILERNIIAITGEEKVESIELDQPFEGQTKLAVDGVFIEIGAVPMVTLLHDLGVALDETSHIVTNTDMSTNVLGVYAAGDVTTTSNKFKQIITAAAEGAIAATSAYQYLKM